MSEQASPPAHPRDARGCDTRSLLLIHGLFRQIFSRAQGLVQDAPPGDAARVKLVKDHLSELLQALHNHHVHEDILWWDRLKQRAPESTADVERMQRAHNNIAREIEALQASLKAWVERPEDKETLLGQLRHIQESLFAHLSDEEAVIMPLAGRVMTQKEWDEAHSIGRDEIPPSRALIQLGYMLHCAPTPELRQLMLDGIPGFVRLLYRLIGRKQFEREWAQLYGNT
ncbi:MAG TPA: hemerythrin domain-containing protein [Clostridia bacterium]|nr:hemerythrin domain-containing protein [Clostridia bacterium]